jgi:hypothetical protein
VSPATLTGDLVLAGVMVFEFEHHQDFNVGGAVVDLSQVTETHVGETWDIWGGHLKLIRSGNQTVIPPEGPDIRLPAIVKETTGDSLRIAPNGNRLYMKALYGDCVLDLGGNDIKIAYVIWRGPVTGLGGCRLELIDDPWWTDGGFLYNQAGTLDLAPSEPWQVIFRNERLEYPDQPEAVKPFIIRNAAIANCDWRCSGAMPALENCSDEGGNHNVFAAEGCDTSSVANRSHTHQTRHDGPRSTPANNIYTLNGRHVRRGVALRLSGPGRSPIKAAVLVTEP